VALPAELVGVEQAGVLWRHISRAPAGRTAPFCGEPSEPFGWNYKPAVG
jgi:hypothetical protein